jgi:hypothetical protein
MTDEIYSAARLRRTGGGPNDGKEQAMSWVSVKDALTLSGEAREGEAVTVKGWVRTRRDSKAGLSFVQLHDGTCHDAIQIVAKNDLPNYEERDRPLTTGCAVEATACSPRARARGSRSRSRRAPSGSSAGSTTPTPTPCP